MTENTNIDNDKACTCPSGDGSLNWPCPQHPAHTAAQQLDLDRLELCAKKGAHVSREEFLALIAQARTAQPAGAEVAAWMTEDGERVVSAATKAGQERDGGASASAMRPYSVPLVRANQPAGAADTTASASRDGVTIPHDVAAHVQHALSLAMAICDAIPTRLHATSEDDPMRHVGMMVNYQESTGAHGYAVIRDAREAFNNAVSAAPVAAQQAAAVAAPIQFYRRNEDEVWRETTTEHVAHLQALPGCAYEFRTLYTAPTAGAATTSEDAPLYSTRQDAARYRFLEEQCRTGTYRGVISREAIDAAMRAAQQEGGNA